MSLTESQADAILEEEYDRNPGGVRVPSAKSGSSLAIASRKRCGVTGATLMDELRRLGESEVPQDSLRRVWLRVLGELACPARLGLLSYSSGSGRSDPPGLERADVLDGRLRSWPQ